MAIFQKPAAPEGFTYALDGAGKETNVLTAKISSAVSSANAAVTAAAKTSPINLSVPTFSADTNGPSLVETMNAIKSGAINADITAGLNKISSVASSLPSTVSSSLADAQAAIATKMTEAQAQLPKLMAVAQANMDLTIKMSIAQTGQPPTEDQLKAASGALAIFQDGPKLLNDQAETISKAVAAAGPAFSAAIPAATDLTKVGLEKATSLATQAGSAVTSFAASIPSATIPDPGNPELTIPNPDYTAFAADPANAAKLSSLSSLTSSVGSLASGLTSGFAAVEEKANTALAGGLTDLKAFAFAAQLATPATGIMATARAASIDTTKLSAAQISKTVEMASKVKTSTPPADEKNGGVDSTGDKLPEPTATPAPPKTAVFGKNPSDKISEGFRDTYWDAVSGVKAQVEKQKTELRAGSLNAFYPGYTTLKSKAKEIEEQKPDAASRTAEDVRILTEYANAKKIVGSKSIVFKTWSQTVKIYNEGAAAYNTLNGLFKANATYGDVPKSVETWITVTTQSWDNNTDGYYATFAEYKAANPNEDFSWSSV